MNANRAAIYVRSATSDEKTMKQQHDACLDFCQRYNLDVVGTLVEAIQGLTLDDWPKLDELRQMIRVHHVDAVVVYNLDTLAHDYGVLITLAHEAEASGVEIHSVTEFAKGELAPMQVDSVLLERELLAMLLRDAYHRERQRWASAV